MRNSRNLNLLPLTKLAAVVTLANAVAKIAREISAGTHIEAKHHVEAEHHVEEGDQIENRVKACAGIQ